MPESILVVGGAGYIGSHMVKQLRRAGFAVAVADDLSSGHRDFVPFGVPFVGGSILNGSMLLRADRMPADVAVADRPFQGVNLTPVPLKPSDSAAACAGSSGWASVQSPTGSAPTPCA